MNTRTRIAVIGLFGLITWFPSWSRADILDDILSLATAARDRATQARDRAAEARDRAIEARNSANEIRDHVREGVAAVSGQVQTLISEAVDDLQQFVASELEGRDAFIADGGCSLDVCEPFRENLMTLLRDIQEIVNTILAIVELEGLSINFDREIEIINLLPGRTLFPLYRVLAVEVNLFSDTRGTGLLARLEAVKNYLIVIKEALEEKCLGGMPQTPLESEVQKCTCVLKNYDRIGDAKKGVTLTGLALKLIAKRLKAKGETTAAGMNPGVHGYFHLTVKDNKKKSIGETLEGISDALSKVAEFADDLLRDCLVYSTQHEMLQNQQDIKDSIKEIQGVVETLRRGDFNLDGHTDLTDFAVFQREFGMDR